MAKGNSTKIKLQSTAGTGYYKTTVINHKNDPEKLRLKKWDPVAREQVWFEEKKIK